MSKTKKSSLMQIQRCFEQDEVQVNRELANLTFRPAIAVFFIFLLVLSIKFEISLFFSFPLSILAGYIIYRIYGVRVANNKTEYLDQLLTNYTPYNQEAYDLLKETVKKNPEEFYTFLSEFIEQEKKKIIKKERKNINFKFTK
ncbi:MULTISPECIES: hypothetical protein [Morganellaceae]|uniref:Uncharacterized protein n=4 Tax=Morganellaceae TaxID=1903414 RepID=A0A2L1KUG2_PROMI|nr:MULTISPECIES: hypothetical protein [Morganellaceae]MEB1123139.1 hypothetical protein [Citrobacter freundii]AVE26218.1 hypothetical protein [Proteus mirabilis]MBS3846215.1 hypothetical protein [Proteus mirabilis]MCI9740339.1 hypothetical protein [Proteus mirabilis]MCI9754036.1 hypothetical protein [Proteus mirabilis]